MSSKKRPVEAEVMNLPASREGFRKNKNYILDSLLTPYDFVPQEVEPCGLFNGRDLIFRRHEVTRLESSNSWKSKHMRMIKEGERPIRVIRREVGGTTRTIELFALNQTEPLPILIASTEAGIPANEFGNVEFDRIPENSILVETDEVPLAIRVCRKLRIVYARCQKGWKRKTPNYIGLVVLKGDESNFKEALRAELDKEQEAEKKAKTDAALSIWKVLLRRIDAEYYITTNL